MPDSGLYRSRMHVPLKLLTVLDMMKHEISTFTLTTYCICD